MTCLQTIVTESDSCSKTDLTKIVRDKKVTEKESDKAQKLSESEHKAGECTDSSSGGNSKQGASLGQRLNFIPAFPSFRIICYLISKFLNFWLFRSYSKWSGFYVECQILFIAKERDYNKKISTLNRNERNCQQYIILPFCNKALSLTRSLRQTRSVIGAACCARPPRRSLSAPTRCANKPHLRRAKRPRKLPTPLRTSTWRMRFLFNTGWPLFS